MTQQSTGPTWTRLLTIALYLLFASLPALSFAVFYALLWVRHASTALTHERIGKCRIGIVRLPTLPRPGFDMFRSCRTHPFHESAL